MKKKKFKYQIGGELYASSNVPIMDVPTSLKSSKKTKNAAAPIFRNKQEYDKYHIEQALSKMSPEDQQFYHDTVAGKFKNTDPASFIALKAPYKPYVEPMGNVLGRAYGLKNGGKLAQQGKKIISGDPMYDEILSKRDSVIQAPGSGYRDWDIFLKKGIEKVKATKAQQLQNKIDSLKVIDDNMGQLKHPGKVTRIDSNKITMKGVNYPVLGISDLGHQQLMLPNQDYNFDGNNVTEFPMGKSGIHIKESHKGLLHKNLGIPAGKKIPASKLAIKEGDSAAVKKRKQFAINAKKWHKGQQGMQVEPIETNWGSENLFVPGQFTAEGQLNQFNNTLPQQNFLGNIGDKLGGPQGILNSATSLIGGVQMLKQGKQQKLQAKQNYELSKLTKQVSELEPERVKRKYFRPEDQIIDPNSVMPTYGVGTNYLAKDGGHLQAGGILPMLGQQAGNFFNGIGAGRSGNLGQMAGSLISGGGGTPSGGGMIGSTLGGVAGSLLGPVGGAVGSFLGGAIGGALDPNARQAKKYNNKANKNYEIAGLNESVEGIRNQYVNFMEDGGYMRIGGHIRPYAMGGELQTYEGGGAAPISENPYLPGNGETVMFHGRSHDEGGINMNFGGNNVEVEGGEPAVKTDDKGLTIFGNMKIPAFGVMELNDLKAKGKKFKNYIADLSENEAKQNKSVDKNMNLINNLEVSTPYDKLKFASGQAMLTGANMRLKDIAQKKKTASIVQNAILETADELGLESDALAKGNIKKAKFGYTAQDGRTISRDEVQKYFDEGWQPLPENPNRLFKKGTSPGDTQTINVGAPGKGGEQFNKEFAEARRKGLKEFVYSGDGKLKTTDLYKGAKKTINTPGTEFTDYLDILDPMKSPTPQATPTGTPAIDAKSKGFNVTDFINTALPYLRPSNQLGLDPNQLAGERLALASNELEPVQAQLYHPLLEQATDISLQDQLNANQADFNSIQRGLGSNPEALASLAAQKYNANSGVLGEQFRQNQTNKMNVFNRNRGTLNDAQLKNLGILDQQYVRQATAKSKTKATAIAAISSISDKIQRNKLENKTLGVLENLYNYRFGPKGYAYNLNPLANFEYPSAGNTGNQYLDSLVPIGKEPEFNSRGQLKDVGTKSKQKNGGLVRAMKGC